MNKYDKLALSIKHARLSKGVSQEKFAEMLDVSATHIKHIESGHRKPSIDILFSICEITGLSIDKVLYEKNFSKSENDIKLETLTSLCSENEKHLIIKLIEAVLSTKP